MFVWENNLDNSPFSVGILRNACEMPPLFLLLKRYLVNMDVCKVLLIFINEIHFLKHVCQEVRGKLLHMTGTGNADNLKT